ncbi:hypothetical protein FACS1894187_02090 [Synergistales bacterium]|nr:hypothetical protein FACS1894187_02090 [Synergistales bacterium]
MSKNSKKKPQKNLPLKDRLEKHWNNRSWGAFVSLYIRDREASERTSWGERWQDALYNCLTNAFFVDKDFQSAEMALDLIYGENDSLFPGLRDCADVVSDFLATRKNMVLSAPSPLTQEANLPPAYASLRKGFASLVSAELKVRRAKKNEAARLVEKLSAQYGKLERAKSASPYSTWLKIAEQLETAAAAAPFADTFRAVRAIVALTRELFRGEREENILRDVNKLAGHQLFKAIPCGQTHPVVVTLWDFFCRSGERKYGTEWGDAARVLQMSFMAGEPHQKNEPLKLSARYKRLMNAPERHMAGLLLSVLSNASSYLTEQEHYILRTLFVMCYNDQEMDTPSLFAGFIESFPILGRLGLKWRPQAPWPKIVQEAFEEVLLSSPKKMLSAFAQMSIPYEAVSALGLLYLAMSDRNIAEKIKETMGSKLPLRLSGSEIRDIAEALSDELTRKDMRTIRQFLDDASYTGLFMYWLRELIMNSGEEALNGCPPSRQGWASIKSELLEELILTLPQGTPEICFCILSLNAGHLRLSEDPLKTDAFFDSFSSKPIFDNSDDKVTRSKLEVAIFMFLLTWPDIEPNFLIRLFGMSVPAHKEAAFYIFGYWESIAKLVDKMPGEAGRKAVAAFVYENITQFAGWKSADLKSAIRILEKLLGIVTKPNGKKPTPQKKKKSALDAIKEQISIIFDEVNENLGKD